MGQRRPRRRRATRSSRPVPAIVAAIGVVIAGFGIGAVIAGFSHRTPAQNAQPAPVHTMVSRVTPIPALSSAPSLAPLHSFRPSAAPRPSLTPRAPATPRAVASPGAVAEQATSSAPQTNQTALPSPLPAAIHAAASPAHSAPAPLSTTPPAVVIETETPAARAAASLVRRYVNAVIRGDEPVAFAALGGAPGDKGLRLEEQDFLDTKSRIVSVRARQHGEASATVEVEIAGGRGVYFATYQVAPSANGPVIESHTIIKP